MDGLPGSASSCLSPWPPEASCQQLKPQGQTDSAFRARVPPGQAALLSVGEAQSTHSTRESFRWQKENDLHQKR